MARPHAYPNPDLAAQIDAQRLNTVQARSQSELSLHNTTIRPPRQSLGQGLKAVGSEAIAPFTAFARNPGLGTGVGAAAAFPWGTRMLAPRRWDAASGGQIVRSGGRYFPDPFRPDPLGNPNPNVREQDLVTTFQWQPHRGPPGVAGASRESAIQSLTRGGSHVDLEFNPRQTEVGYVHTNEQAPPGLMFDLLAPAVNRFNVYGKPIAAHPINPRVALAMMGLNRRAQRQQGRNMFTEHSLSSAYSHLEETAGDLAGGGEFAQSAARRGRMPQAELALKMLQANAVGSFIAPQHLGALRSLAAERPRYRGSH